MGARVGTEGLFALLPRPPRHWHCLPFPTLRVRVGSCPTPPRVLAAVAAAPPPASAPAPAPAPPLSPAPNAQESGPIELPEDQDPFAIPTSPLQTAASIVLTGTLAVFLYRSLRRRVKLSKETKFRSSGLENVNEASKQEPVSTANPGTANSPPSAFQTIQGAILAGAIAWVLYKFATTVEAGFALKPVSPVYTIRQLTITVRTIINGLCYLATFVFAANSIGLTMYSLQLLFNLGPTETTKKQDNKTVTDQAPLETESLEEVKKE